MERQVIVGAGPVGSGVATLLADRGVPVTVLTRKGSGPQHPLITLAKGDAQDADLLTASSSGAAAIYNCVNPPYHPWATDWPPVHRALVAAAERTGAVLVIMDNLYAFGPAADMPMCEGDPMQATGTKGATRAMMARELLRAHAEGRLRATLARASDFFGPGVRNAALGERVVPKVIAGKNVSVLGDPDQPHSLSYMPDVVRTLVTIAGDERAWGKPWHVPNAPAVTQREAVALLAGAAGTTVKVSAVPKWLVRGMGLFVPMMRDLLETWYQFDRPFVTDSTLTERTFNLAATSLDEASGATIAWWRAGAPRTRSGTARRPERRPFECRYPVILFVTIRAEIGGGARGPRKDPTNRPGATDHATIGTVRGGSLGAIWFRGSELVAAVSEMVGFKTGLALTRDRMVELLEDSIEAEGFFEAADDAPVRVRSDDVEAVIHELLFKLGHTSTPQGVHPAIELYHRHKGRPATLKRALAILEEWMAFMAGAVARARTSGERKLDPTPFLEDTFKRHGRFGAKVALQLFDDFDIMVVQNPWNQVRRNDWKDVAELEGLFRSESLSTYYGQFFDQRFIDYLARQFDEIDRINWRKFEGLVGEYFHREGFQVRLGPGRNDEGVDARIWPRDDDIGRPPALLVQCKRQKETVSKVVVKALYADVVHEGATSGLIVTTSALSPGAKKVCSVRSYPIKDADRTTLRKWIEEMRSPGSGVFLGE